MRDKSRILTYHQKMVPVSELHGDFKNFKFFWKYQFLYHFSLILHGLYIDFKKIWNILKNNKNYENFKIGFRENFKNKSCRVWVNEQKTFLLQPPKNNISSFRTPFSSEFWHFRQNIRKYWWFLNVQNLANIAVI